MNLGTADIQADWVDYAEDLWLGDSLSATESRLGALARAAGPLRRVSAALASRLCAERAWERVGYARLGDYARERLGVSARSVQELARVGRALKGLPALESALVSGRLPWSKIRLLARFVTAEEEARVIRYAEGVSVRRLEHELRVVDRTVRGRSVPIAVTEVDRERALVAEFDTDEEGASTAVCEAVRLSVPMGLRFKWQRACACAAQVGGENVPAGTVLEWVTAESASALSGLVGEGAESDERTDGTRGGVTGRFDAQALTGEVASVCASHGAVSELCASECADAEEGLGSHWVPEIVETGDLNKQPERHKPTPR